MARIVAGRRAPVVTDSGYAWVILAAAFACQFLSVGLTFSSGVFFMEFLDAFGESRGTTAWVGSINVALVTGCGPLVLMAIHKFGTRVTVIAGGLLASLGFCLCSAANSLWVLFITFAIMPGIGLSMACISATMSLSHYFDKRKSLAFSGTAVSVGLANIVVPLISKEFIEAFAWRGAMIALGGMALNLVVIGALMRPVAAVKDNSSSRPMLKETLAACKSWKFAGLFANIYMFNIGIGIFLLLVPDYAIDKGVSRDSGVLLLSISGLSNLVGRLITMATSACNFNRAVAFVIYCGLCGTTIITFSMFSAFEALATCSALFGLLFGLQIGNYAVVIHRIMGTDDFQKVFGLLMFADGFGVATGPPFAGSIAAKSKECWCWCYPSCVGAGRFGDTAPNVWPDGPVGRRSRKILSSNGRAFRLQEQGLRGAADTALAMDQQSVPGVGLPGDCSGRRRRSHRDRGYAWVIMCCGVGLQALSVGTAFSVGVFYVEFLEAFGVSRGEAALVGSLHGGLLFLPGPFVSMLLLRLSHRTVAMCGSVIACIGLVSGAFAQDVWTLYITYGSLGGVGFCMVYIPAVTLPGEYFDEKRNLAFALGAVGGGMGTLIMPQVAGLLIEALAWRGALVLLAGLVLQMAVLAALMRPPPVERRLKRLPTLVEVQEVCASGGFAALMLNSFLFNFGNLIFFVLVTDYGRSKGLDEQRSIWLLSAAGLASSAGRLLVAALGACACNRMFLYISSCFLSGVAVGIIPLHDEFYFYCVCTVSFGLFFGVQLANYAIVTAEVVGADKFELAYGFLMLTDGVGALAGPPLAGWLYSVLGGYEAGFYFGGAAIMLAAVILLPITTKCHKARAAANSLAVFTVG